MVLISRYKRCMQLSYTVLSARKNHNLIEHTNRVGSHKSPISFIIPPHLPNPISPFSPPSPPLPSSRFFQDAFSLQSQHSFLPQTQNRANPQNQTSKNPTHRSQPNLKDYSAHQPSHPARRRAKPEKSKEIGAQAAVCAEEEDGRNGRGGDEGCRCEC